MPSTYLFYLLRFTRALMLLVLLATGGMALVLAGRIYDAADEPEMRLRVDTFRPNLFGFWHDAQAGFDDGWHGLARQQRGPLPALHPTTKFELAADPHAPLLRYREPSPWKRASLMALGALDDNLSVVGLLFLAGCSWLLLGLLQDVASGTPFTPANGRRLLQLALLVAGVNLWQYVAYLLVWALVPAYHVAELVRPHDRLVPTPTPAYHVAELVRPLSHYVRLNTDDLVPGFEVGFILLVIAAVYRRGVELSQEAELVI